jgi:dephospho-CoA kinase
MTRDQPIRGRIPVIGIVGGVGAGKSTLCRWMVNHTQVGLIDGDRTGHDALLQPDVIIMISERFGQDVLNAEHQIERRILGAKVWGNSPDKIQARQDLNHILHPQMEQQFEALIQQYQADLTKDVILFDAAIMLDVGWDRFCDRIVFLETLMIDREARVKVQRAWSKDDLVAREQSQLSLDEKKSQSDFIIDNTGSLENAGQQFLDFIQSLKTNTNDIPHKSL